MIASYYFPPSVVNTVKGVVPGRVFASCSLLRYKNKKSAWEQHVLYLEFVSIARVIVLKQSNNEMSQDYSGNYMIEAWF